MKQSEVNRFDKLCERRLKNLKLPGKAQKTIDACARFFRRVRNCFDCRPDKSKPEQVENDFADLVESHSWIAVEIDRLGSWRACPITG